MLPKMPIKITFDPVNKVWWNHPQTKILVLLWKPCHITSQYFYEDAMRNGKRIAENKPKTAKELRNCLFGIDFEGGDHDSGDASKFAVDALPYFLGLEEVMYEICL